MAKKYKTWNERVRFDLTTEQLKIAESMWRAGDLEFLLAETQKDLYRFLHKLEKLLVISASRQIGKTYSNIVFCLSFAIKNPGSRIFYGFPTETQSRDVVIKTMNEVLSSCPVDIRPATKVRATEWHFKNGSQIDLVGINTDDGNRLRGMAGDLFILDECRDMPKLDTIYQSVVRAILITRKGKCIMISTPPDSTGHAFTKHFIEQSKERGTFKKADWRVSPFTTEEEMAEVEADYPGGKDNVRFRREWLADESVMERDLAIVPSFNRIEQDELFQTYVPESRFIQPWVGIDLGNRDRTALIFSEYDSVQNKLVVVGEEFLRNPTTSEIAIALMNKEEKLWRGKPYQLTRRVTDVDLRFINDMRSQYAISMQQVRKEDRISMINRLDLMFYSKNIIVDTKSCEVLTHELETGIWKEDKKDYVRDQITQSHMDGIDALKYIELTLSRRNSFSVSEEPNVRFGTMNYAEILKMREKQVNRKFNNPLLGVFNGSR